MWPFSSPAAGCHSTPRTSASGMVRTPASALAVSVFQFHSSRTRSPSKLAVPSPAEADTGSAGPGSR